MRKVISISGVILIIVIISIGDAFASGACCTVSKGSADRMSAYFTAASAWSHEEIAGNHYTMKQQAITAKVAYPIWRNLIVMGQFGIPLATRLSHSIHSTSGKMGYIYGLGLAFAIPDIIPPVELYSSLSLSRSHGFLSESSHGESKGQFIISELQGSLLGDLEIIKRLNFYGGARFYVGKNRWHFDNHNMNLEGDREGNISPLIGLRYALSPSFSLIGEGSFGHTKVASLSGVMGL